MQNSFRMCLDYKCLEGRKQCYEHKTSESWRGQCFKGKGVPKVCIIIHSLYTAISRKVVGKIVHVTIPKGNMGYVQYTVPDDCSRRTYFCCFPLALANTFPWPFVPILSHFVEEKRTQNHPQCLSGLLCALFPTTFLEIAVYKPWKPTISWFAPQKG